LLDIGFANNLVLSLSFAAAINSLYSESVDLRSKEIVLFTVVPLKANTLFGVEGLVIFFSLE